MQLPKTALEGEGAWVPSDFAEDYLTQCGNRLNRPSNRFETPELF